MTPASPKPQWPPPPCDGHQERIRRPPPPSGWWRPHPVPAAASWSRGPWGHDRLPVLFAPHARILPLVTSVPPFRCGPAVRPAPACPLRSVNIHESGPSALLCELVHEYGSAISIATTAPIQRNSISAPRRRPSRERSSDCHNVMHICSRILFRGQEFAKNGEKRATLHWFLKAKQHGAGGGPPSPRVVCCRRPGPAADGLLRKPPYRTPP